MLCAWPLRSHRLSPRDHRTYAPTWSGTVYVAFVIYVYAQRIGSWSASTSMKTQFVHDALDQTIRQRKTPNNKSSMHLSDRGSQYQSIKYTERLAAAEIALTVGTTGDAYGNALAEYVIGLFKPKCSIRSALGNRSARSNEISSCGSIGIVIAACSAPSATCHPLKQRRRSMQT